MPQSLEMSLLVVLDASAAWMSSTSLGVLPSMGIMVMAEMTVWTLLSSSVLVKPGTSS